MKKMQTLETAVQILNNGGVVAIPTETVYGLAADATNEKAIQTIFRIKDRPLNHPLIVHIGNKKEISNWAMDIKPEVQLLIEHFWPGPLTLVFKKQPHVSTLITGEQETVAVRMPAHPLTLALLQRFKKALVAPSANKFTRISPTTAAAVYEELGDAVDLIVDGGPCTHGLESTILDVSGDKPTILRPGVITVEMLEAVYQQKIDTHKTMHSPRVSGNHELHYAPRTRTELVSTDNIKSILKNANQDAITLLSFAGTQLVASNVKIIQMPLNAAQYGQQLYAALRAADKHRSQKILIEMVPNDPTWYAIQDRLQRACGKG